MFFNHKKSRIDNKAKQTTEIQIHNEDKIVENTQLKDTLLYVDFFNSFKSEIFQKMDATMNESREDRKEPH